MVEVIIWNPFERLLWGIAISILSIEAILYVKKSLEKRILKERAVLFGYVGLLLGSVISIIFNFLSFLVIGI